MNVVFTTRARGHLRGIKRYISENSYPERAEAFVARILDHCESLSTFPIRGLARDDLDTRNNLATAEGM